MKFLILEKYGSRTIEAEDFDDAVQEAYDTHTGYKDVMAIVKCGDDE